MEWSDNPINLYSGLTRTASTGYATSPIHNGSAYGEPLYQHPVTVVRFSYRFSGRIRADQLHRASRMAGLPSTPEVEGQATIRTARAGKGKDYSGMSGEVHIAHNAGRS